MRINNLSFQTAESSGNYVNMSQKELMGQFLSSNWNQLSKSEKLQLIEEAGNRYAAQRGIFESIAFVEEMDSNLAGGYCAAQSVISININEVDNPYQVLDSIAHEVNHAYQDQCIKLDDSTVYSDQELALLKAENSRTAYISGGDGYIRQSLEVDSNVAGAEYVLEYKDQFVQDQSFQEYLDERGDFFESINQEYNAHPEECNISEYHQILTAYSTGALSDQEMLLAEECLKNGNNSIRWDSDMIASQIDETKQQISLETDEHISEEMSSHAPDGLEFLVADYESGHSSVYEGSYGTESGMETGNDNGMGMEQL